VKGMIGEKERSREGEASNRDRGEDGTHGNERLWEGQRERCVLVVTISHL
jgi:hypothetical protein